MAVSTVSPNLSEQFNALVPPALVTNVVPSIIAPSARTIMIKAGPWRVPSRSRFVAPPPAASHG